MLLLFLLCKEALWFQLKFQPQIGNFEAFPFACSALFCYKLKGLE
jgi:hypothetical protein